MELFDRDDLVLVGYMVELYRGFHGTPCPSVWYSNASKDNTILDNNIYYLHDFYGCASNIFKSVLEIGRQQKQHSAQKLACTGLSSYPSHFVLIASIKTIRQQLICVLCAPIVLSLVSFYPIASMDAKHRVTAGMGMMCIVWNGYRTSSCKMFCSSALSILATRFLLFFSIYQICCLPDHVAITSICTYCKYDKNHILIHLVSMLFWPMHPPIKWNHRSIHLCFFGGTYPSIKSRLPFN